MFHHLVCTVKYSAIYLFYFCLIFLSLAVISGISPGLPEAVSVLLTQTEVTEVHRTKFL